MVTATAEDCGDDTSMAVGEVPPTLEGDGC